MVLVGTVSELRVASVSLMSLIDAIPTIASPVCVVNPNCQLLLANAVSEFPLILAFQMFQNAG